MRENDGNTVIIYNTAETVLKIIRTSAPILRATQQYSLLYTTLTTTIYYYNMSFDVILLSLLVYDIIYYYYTYR